MMLNALTIDVEDYFQVTGFASVVRPENWDTHELRVERNTQLILDRLAAAEVRGTFFVLGWVARRCPQLVRAIAAAGHEIASHGFWHQLVTTQSPDEFRTDVREAKSVLEDCVGSAVTAYRAPSFSIAPDRTWAFEVLVEEGHTTDSSVAAGRRASCGHLAADGAPFELQTSAGLLMEYPLPTVRVLGRRVPVGGGGFFRLWPYGWTRRQLRKINAGGKPFAVYLHPWEFDPDQPRLPVAWPRRFKHYVNLRRTEPRFRRILQDFQFGTLSASANAFFGKSSVAPAPVSIR
jgi:polysaccharide deacetylase family protein (PEP-CTERM system associated)